ncbi:MAG: DUF4352 domain-containing protein [Anaerolineae bacterium]|nr:DUF4352 domain-containing protein [Anaerolineae bacterium]
MTRGQWAIIIVLAVLVVGVFGIAAWLYLRPVGPVVLDTPTPWHPPTFPPTWTPVPAWAPTATEQVRRAQATVTAIAARTATAQARMDAALVQFPAVEIGLRMDGGAAGMTLLRAGWVRYGVIWMRVRMENLGSEPLHLAPASFSLIDTRENRHPVNVDETARARDGLTERDLAPGESAEVVLIFPVEPGSLPGQLIYEDGRNPTLALDIYNWLLSRED